MYSIAMAHEMLGVVPLVPYLSHMRKKTRTLSMDADGVCVWSEQSVKTRERTT